MTIKSHSPSRANASLAPHSRGTAVAILAAVSVLSAHGLSADTIPVPPEPAPAAAILEPERPHHDGGVLYWRNHRLAALCGEVDGHFAKLASSSVYACTGGELGEGEVGS